MSGASYLVLGKIGHIGKGVALAIVGGLFVYAGITHESGKSGGLDEALSEGAAAAVRAGAAVRDRARLPLLRALLLRPGAAPGPLRCRGSGSPARSLGWVRPAACASWWAGGRSRRLGTFTDVMLAEPDGTRVLLAPSQEVADLVATTYHFDRVEIGPVSATDVGHGWRVRGPGLEVSFEVGRRSWLGRLLRLVPRRIATAPAWAIVTDPFAQDPAPRRTHARHGRERAAGVLRSDRPAPAGEPRRLVARRRPRRTGAVVTRARFRVRLHPGAAVGDLARHHDRPALGRVRDCPHGDELM